jgi:hypothetical protein
MTSAQQQSIAAGSLRICSHGFGRIPIAGRIEPATPVTIPE